MAQKINMKRLEKAWDAAQQFCPKSWIVRVDHFQRGEVREEGQHSTETSGAGWYAWYTMPGFMDRSDLCGPYRTKASALEALAKSGKDYADNTCTGD